MASKQIPWSPIMDDFGAVVDIDLNAGLTDAQSEELLSIFDERGLLIFRKQDIPYETQRSTVGTFGNLLASAGDAKYVSTVHDVEGNPVEQPRDIDPRAAMFHSDLIFMPSLPIRGISLFAEDVQKGVGNVEGTRFISNRRAYLALPEDVRTKLDGFKANHLHSLSLTVEQQQALRRMPFEEAKAHVDFWSQHPLFHPNPRTGEPILLYVPWFTHSIEGLSAEESQHYFDLFDSVLYKEECIYTHRWVENDLLVWDNIALQHAKEQTKADAGPVPRRVLRRAIFGTEQPQIYGAGYSFDAEQSKRDEAVA